MHMAGMFSNNMIANVWHGELDLRELIDGGVNLKGNFLPRSAKEQFIWIENVSLLLWQKHGASCGAS